MQPRWCPPFVLSSSPTMRDFSQPEWNLWDVLEAFFVLSVITSREWLWHKPPGVCVWGHVAEVFADADTLPTSMESLRIQIMPQRPFCLILVSEVSSANCYSRIIWVYWNTANICAHMSAMWLMSASHTHTQTHMNMNICIYSTENTSAYAHADNQTCVHDNFIGCSHLSHLAHLYLYIISRTKMTRQRILSDAV